MCANICFIGMQVGYYMLVMIVLAEAQSGYPDHVMHTPRWQRDNGTFITNISLT